MSVRDELLAAIDAGDDQAVHRLGWGGVWEDLATGWKPREVCGLKELRVYVRFVGDEDPADVQVAIHELAGDWRPKPGEIRGHLNRRKPGYGSRVNAGPGRCREMTPEALEDVANLHRAGEPACSCGWHRNQWDRDPGTWVRRCPACDGLEPGQLHAAEDLDLMEAAA